MNSKFKINDKPVGGGAPTFLIAEIAQAHDGSLGLAHAFIDAAAEAKADAVKFQTHIAAAESTRQEKFRVNFSRQDTTRYDYWKRIEFSPEQWRGLAEHAKASGLAFLSSAFSMQAIDLLDELDVPAWKIASGEIRSQALIDRVASTGKPLLVSTGMSPWAEIEETVDYLRDKETDFCLMQCTSKYPTPLNEVGINVISQYRERFGCSVGLSDHSGTIFPSLAAIATGCDVIELHLTLDRNMFGPDVASSLDVSEFSIVSAARDAFYEMQNCPVDKDKMAEQLNEMRALFMRSAAPARDLEKGTIITSDMIAAKKPGTGIPLSEIPRMIGRKLTRPVAADELFEWGDFV